jgi:hypothetical protein
MTGEMNKTVAAFHNAFGPVRTMKIVFNTMTQEIIKLINSHDENRTFPETDGRIIASALEKCLLDTTNFAEVLLAVTSSFRASIPASRTRAARSAPV